MNQPVVVAAGLLRVVVTFKASVPPVIRNFRRIELFHMKGRLFIAGIVMLAISPLLRLFEAIIRTTYMPDHYGSFWSAFSRDIWFINGWWTYIKTPIGKGLTIFNFSWLGIAVIFILGSIALFYLKDN